MTARGLVRAHRSHPGFIRSLVSTLAGLTFAVWCRIDAVLASLPACLLVGCPSDRFIAHGQCLYRFRPAASLWKRACLDHRQDPRRTDALFGSPPSTWRTTLAAGGRAV